ncbi:MAG TPA: hypothetical protein VMZ74_12030 [Ramlibacter sp.]|nr:hypothetical protein [Ramlibacter sp.]
MPLLGKAALAMWWDMAPAMRTEFEDWHTHEHFPERLSLPGFLRGSRWRDAEGGEGFFVLYELDSHAQLASPEYLARLNAPTPWSTKLMPHHRNMVRSQCVVEYSEGGGVAGHAVTMRLPRDPGVASQVQGWCARPGISGVHILRAQAPAIAPTTEQKIRGHSDRVADCIVVVCGYEDAALREVCRHLVVEEAVIAHHVLALSMTRGDVRNNGP